MPTLDLAAYLRRRAPTPSPSDLLDAALRAYEAGDTVTAAERYTDAARAFRLRGMAAEAEQVGRWARMCADEAMPQGAQVQR